MGMLSKLEEIFQEEKHMNKHLDAEFKLLERQASTREDHELRSKQQLVQEHEDQQYSVTIPVLSAASLGLKLKIPWNDEEEREKDDSNDGFRTPTSAKHKIPAMLPYPPAPRKPKSQPSNKRKGCQARTMFDVSQEIESLFSTPFAMDIGVDGLKKLFSCSKEEKDKRNGEEDTEEEDVIFSRMDWCNCKEIM